MTDTKAALDIINEEIRANTEVLKHPAAKGFHIVKAKEELKKWETVKQALTTPPAPTVTDVEVQRAVENAKEALNLMYCSDTFYGHHADAIETLIRAATQQPQATDVNYLIRDLDIIRVILESSKDAVSADFQRIERLQDFIRNAALQSPAVPKGELLGNSEELPSIEQIVDILSEYLEVYCAPHCYGGTPSKESKHEAASKILALLGGKERK